MSLCEKYFYVSVEDYLAGEKLSPVRHEYVDGVVYAMAGGAVRHSRLAKNIYSRLERHLESSEGNQCEVFIFDTKVRVSPTIYYYPDMVVTCEQLDDNDLEILEPRLIIEVLSDSTAATDRREKLREYRYIPTLHEYLIIWQNEMRVELFRRQEGDIRQLLMFTQPEEPFTLSSMGLTLELREVYRHIHFA
jgi:Uma2 family endonuclease